MKFARGSRLTAAICLLALSAAAVACVPPPTQAPTPVATPMPTRAIPTPTSDTAVIHGILLDVTTKAPLVDHPVYLAEIIATGGEGGMMVASMEPTTAPRAYTDSSGTFVFMGIAPKAYALATVTPSGHVLFVRPETRVEITATARPSETVNLGTVLLDSKFGN